VSEFPSCHFVMDCSRCVSLIDTPNPIHIPCKPYQETQSLLPLNRLPRRRFSLSNFRARRSRPSFNSIPNIPRRLTSIVANHSASIPTRTPTRSARQSSEHATSSLSSFLLIQTSSLSRAHFLREQVLLVACWMACGHRGWRLDGTEVYCCGCLLLSMRSGRVGGVRWREIDLRWWGVQGV
jgi:hypothetical protein